MTQFSSVIGLPVSRTSVALTALHETIATKCGYKFLELASGPRLGYDVTIEDWFCEHIPLFEGERMQAFSDRGHNSYLIGGSDAANFVLSCVKKVAFLYSVRRYIRRALYLY